MGCVIDHLQVDHRVRVLREFKDARGARHASGETGVIRRMALDWATQEIVIEWERDGEKEKMLFPLAAKEGPRNGRMRDFFELEERVPLPEDTIAGRAHKPVPLPELAPEPVIDPKRYSDAVDRVWALAARRRFDEAEQQMQTILAEPDPYGGTLQGLAEEMVSIAVRHANDEDPAVFDWLSQRAITLWYAWGSCATSGGDGAARAPYIRAAEKRIADCEARRRR